MNLQKNQGYIGGSPRKSLTCDFIFGFIGANMYPISSLVSYENFKDESFISYQESGMLSHHRMNDWFGDDIEWANNPGNHDWQKFKFT